MRKAITIFLLFLFTVLTFFVSFNNIPVEEKQQQSSILVGITEEERHGSGGDDLHSFGFDFILGDYHSHASFLRLTNRPTYADYQHFFPSGEPAGVLLPPELF